MECVAQASRNYITGLVTDPSSGALYAVCGASGDLLRLRGSTLDVVGTCDSIPTGVAADGKGNLYVTSATDQTVLRLEADGDGFGPAAVYLSKFEGKSFLSPTGVAISATTGELFFSDAGGPGESAPWNPVGALYRTVQGHSQLVPVCAYGLQQPAALAAGRDGCVYVAEQAANRVLRFAPSGAHYVGSVFCQLAGGMGPAAVAVSPRDGAVVVAMYDTDALAAAYDEPPEGRVMVLNRDGSVRAEVLCEDGAQLRAIAISADGADVFAALADEKQCRSAVYKFSIPDQ